MKKKTVALLLALVLVFGVAAGGTLAWLTDKTGEVTNTFTYGDINIELTETTGNDYKIVPGVDIAKDPKVTVEANSEACWLFVKVEETGTFVKDKVTYNIANGWTALEGANGVYYREVDATAAKAGASYYVLAGNDTYPNGVVNVSENLTKTDVNSITTKPTLTFTAYAVQAESFDTAAAAWAEASK